MIASAGSDLRLAVNILRGCGHDVPDQRGSVTTYELEPDLEQLVHSRHVNRLEEETLAGEYEQATHLVYTGLLLEDNFLVCSHWDVNITAPNHRPPPLRNDD
jgi:hypothetical protein